MGLGGISVWSLLLIFAICVVLFGGKKITNMVGDLGHAIGSFKRGMYVTSTDEEDAEQAEAWKDDGKG
jgi:TatA/E family protein of Tat protein translocase